MTEGAVALAGLLLCTVLIFSTRSTSLATSIWLPAVIIPFLLWMAWRAGPAAAALGSFVLCLIAVIFEVNGLGPFATAADDPAGHLLSLQVFLGIAVFGALAMSAAAGEGREAQAALGTAERRFRTLVEQVPTVTYVCA